MLFRRRLEFDVAEVVPDLQGLTSATRELKDSARFKGVLQVSFYLSFFISTPRGADADDSLNFRSFSPSATP